MCTVLLPPGGYPIAVKYIVLYHIPTFTVSISVNFPSVCACPDSTSYSGVMYVY